MTAPQGPSTSSPEPPVWTKFSGNENLTIKDGFIVYQNHRYRACVTDQNGHVTNADEKQLKQIMRILAQANFHTTAKDLSNTVIANHQVVVNGTPEKVIDQEKVNSLFNKVFKNAMPQRAEVTFTAETPRQPEDLNSPIKSKKRSETPPPEEEVEAEATPPPEKEKAKADDEKELKTRLDKTKDEEMLKKGNIPVGKSLNIAGTIFSIYKGTPTREDGRAVVVDVGEVDAKTFPSTVELKFMQAPDFRGKEIPHDAFWSLEQMYYVMLENAVKDGVKNITFPPISTGIRAPDEVQKERQLRAAGQEVPGNKPGKTKEDRFNERCAECAMNAIMKFATNPKYAGKLESIHLLFDPNDQGKIDAATAQLNLPKWRT